MALPQQLKSARMTDATTGNLIDNHVGDLEKALCDIFGITVDVNVTETPLDLDNSGRITKQLLRLAAAAPMGIRFRDTTNGKEFRLSLNNNSITIDHNTGSEGTPTWTNRLTISLTTGLPTLGSSTDPSGANDLARKAYVDSVAAGGGPIPAGTKMLFFQAAAPSGWTKDLVQNDKVVRVTTGSGGGTGGNWTITGLTVQGHTLTIGEIPSHNHTYDKPTNIQVYNGAGASQAVSDISQGSTTGSAGGGGSHTHGITAGSSWRPAYIDCIICTKN